MSHGKIREDKVCLNCGHLVEERFCRNCGQENIETRQSFYYLFTHFIEDFTHYDGQFWKTIKYLLIRPGKLTKEYLAGKRQLYVAPVKLYIFVSFITFFLPSLLGSSDSNERENKPQTAQEILAEQEQEKKLAQLTDSLKTTLLPDKELKPIVDNKLIKINEVKEGVDEGALGKTKEGKMTILGAQNLKQYDSLYEKRPDKQRSYDFLRPVAKKVFHLQEKKGMNRDEILELFAENMVHTLPKALFVYLPIFAFFLWIFHNKKKWWYFDHGIFTLHYFSFLLLGTLIFIFGTELMKILPDYGILTLFSVLLYTAAILYMSVYFFIAHHRVYETSKRMSILKGSILFMVNFFGLLAMFLALVYVSFLTLH